MPEVGKCPKCDSLLCSNDIKQVTLDISRVIDKAYVCKKCNYIIGFSARVLPGL